MVLLSRLVEGLINCRKAKRNTASARASKSTSRQPRGPFDELAGWHLPSGPVHLLIITRPSHARYGRLDSGTRANTFSTRLGPRFERPHRRQLRLHPRRGTTLRAQRLESKVRSISANWSRPACISMRLRNFFVAIDSWILEASSEAKIRGSSGGCDLAELILLQAHPRTDSSCVPPESCPGASAQRLLRQPAHPRPYDRQPLVPVLATLP